MSEQEKQVEIKTTDEPLRFQYYSQWGSLECNEPLILEGLDPSKFHNWVSDGYPDVDSYRLWSRNTCGIACLQSVLSASNTDIPKKYDLIQMALDYGAFVQKETAEIDGLYYAPFVQMLKMEFGIEACSMPALSLSGIAELAAQPDIVVMASVSKEIRTPSVVPAKKGGHLVLIQDYVGDTFFFHNPSGLRSTANYTGCSSEQFENFYAQRGIVIDAKGARFRIN